MKPKFKIGDRVKLIRDTDSYRNDLKKGDIGIIESFTLSEIVEIKSFKGITKININGLILQKKKITNWKEEMEKCL